MVNWLLVSSAENFERNRAEPVITLEPQDYLPAEPLARELRYTKRWPAANWTLAFQGNVHELDDTDADLLERTLETAASGVTALR
jgi:hypothetical protein